MPWQISASRNALEVLHSETEIHIGRDSPRPHLIFRVIAKEDSGIISVRIGKNLLPPMRAVMPCDEYKMLMDCNNIKFQRVYRVVTKKLDPLGWKCQYLFTGVFPNVCKPHVAFSCSAHVQAKGLDSLDWAALPTVMTKDED